MKIEYLTGDVREVLKTIPDESVQCCVTSPPYWGLRDYGTAEWEGGNDPDCVHAAAKEKSRFDYSLDTSPIQRGERTGTDAPKWKDVCPTCGAKKVDSQIGMEKTPDEYVQNLVDVFREVRRVLRKDGTLWLNLGDSYANNSTNQAQRDQSGGFGNPKGTRGAQPSSNASIGAVKTIPAGLKQKDLVGIPWRVAFALQADGWWLRSDIIWHKPNPMPSSVKDRPTTNHEYIFLLTKSAKYFYDDIAIAEPLADATVKRAEQGTWQSTGGKLASGHIPMSPESFNKAVGTMIEKGCKNKRSVWTMNVKPFPDAHFAVFPPELPETCIKAGTSEGGCCDKCGTPYVRVTQTIKHEPSEEYDGQATKDYEAAKAENPSDVKRRVLDSMATETKTIGWEPSCVCGGESVPCVVLDTFAGSGTTLMVARSLGRSAIGVDLNEGYKKIADKRCMLSVPDIFSFGGG